MSASCGFRDLLLLGLCVALLGACGDRRAPVPLDVSDEPVRGGALEIVGQSDVDHLTTTGAFTVTAIWEMQPLARQLWEVTAGDAVRGFKMLCNPVVPAGPLSVLQSIVEGLTVFCASRSSPRSR